MLTVLTQRIEATVEAINFIKENQYETDSGKEKEQDIK